MASSRKRRFYPIPLWRRPRRPPRTAASNDTIRQRGWPGTRAADRGNPLHDRRTLALDQSLLECDEREPVAHDVGELPGCEEERGIRRASKPFVPGGERFVEQRAVGGERREEVREQRTVQVIGDDDRIEHFAGKGPWRILEV